MGMMRRDGFQLRAGHTLHAHMLQQCPFVLRITRDASLWTGTQLWLFRSLAAASMGDCSLTNSNRQTGLTTSQSVPWHPRPTPQIITTSSGKGAGQNDEGDLAASCTRDEHRKFLKKVLAEGEARPFQEPAPQTVRGKSAISTATVRCGPQRDSVGTRSCWTWSACRHDRRMVALHSHSWRMLEHGHISCVPESSNQCIRVMYWTHCLHATAT